MPWIQANGASLRYELTANPGKPVLVLVHEAGGCMESYDECMPGLAPHYRVLRYDQRGFGFSEKMAQIRFETVVEDLRGLLDALDITEPVHLCGGAMGSDFVTGFAATHAQRAASILIASPNIGVRADNSRTLSRADLVEREGMRAAMEASHALSWPQVLRAPDPARFARYQARWACNTPWSFAAQARMMSSVDLTPYYPRITARALVAGARHDTQRPIETARKVAAAIKGAAFVEVDSGHFFAMQTPDLFVRTVRGFMPA